jgi:hypothetical protein
MALHIKIDIWYEKELAQESRLHSWQGQEIFLFSTATRPDSGGQPTSCPVNSICGTEVKNMWIYTFIPLYMGWCLIN